MRKTAAVLGLGLGASAIVLAIAAAGALDRWELWLYDWRTRQVADPAAVHPDIAIVLIDDQTIQDGERLFGRWPWPRLAHTFLFNFLNRGPARVIAFDVGIWERDVTTHRIGEQEWSGGDSDATLVEAVREAGNVVLLANAAHVEVQEQAHAPAGWPDPGYRLGSGLAHRPNLLPPIQALTNVAAALGHNFLPLDPDGPARRMPPFVAIGNRHVPSLGVATALVAGGFRPEDVALEGRVLRVGDRRVPLVHTRVPDPLDPDVRHDRLSMMIRWHAPPNVTSYPTYRAGLLIESEDALLSGGGPVVDPAVFRDKIVFIGVSAAGTGDVFQTPFASGSMPGAQLHATMADNLLSGRFIRVTPDWIRLASVIALGVLASALAILLSYTIGVLSTAAIAIVVVWASVLLFKDGLWINLSQPVSVMALSLFAGTAYRYFVEDREKRVVKRLFGRYVSKDVYEQLLEHPERAELGGARRDMTVLFSDIRGFTSVTERGQPEALVSQLNEYFSRMVDIVFRHQGTVDKFVGDMVMALFGAPVDDPQHAEHAVRAAVDMVAELGELNRKWAAEGRAQLDVGIGVHSGEMIAGNIGSSSIMSYTVIGDNVNLGARLESLNKDYKCRIIISEATRARLRAAYDIRPLGDVVVKGKSVPVEIFQVCVPSPLPDKEAQT